MGVSGTCYNHFTIYINRTIMLYAFVNCFPVKLGRGGGRIVLATVLSWVKQDAQEGLLQWQKRSCRKTKDLGA